MPLTEAAEWRTAGCPHSILYLPRLLEEINQLAVEGFYRFRRGGLEVGGLLFGHRRGNEWEIAAYVPICCEHALGPGFRLSAPDRDRLRESLQQTGTDSKYAGMEPIGFYRSVTRGPIRLTEEDADLVASFLKPEHGVVLVVRPDAVSPTCANFFYFDSGVWRSDPAAQMTLGMGRPGKSDEKPVAEVPEQLMPAEPEPDPAPIPELWTLPQPANRRRKNAWLIAVLGLLIAGLLWWSVKPDIDLGLTLVDNSGQLHVVWSGRAAESLAARRGWIEIHDGEKRLVTEFSGDELRKGSLYVVRRSHKTVVKMVVERSNGERVEESAVFGQ